MPFLVVVYTPDRTRADMIAKRYSAGDAGTAVGVYRFPSRRDAECTCQSWGRNDGWTRHPDGHLVHGTCMLRRRDFRTRIRVSFMDWFGMNLIRRSDTPTLFQNPEGWDPR